MSILHNTSVCGGCRGFFALNNLSLAFLLSNCLLGKTGLCWSLRQPYYVPLHLLQVVSWISVTWLDLPILTKVPRFLDAWSSYKSGESSSTILGRLQLAWLALMDLVAICGWMKFTLSGQCDLPSKSRGTSAIHFWYSNTSSLAKWGSRVQKSYALGSLAMALFRTLGFLVHSAVHWTTRSCSSSFLGPVLA